HPRQADCAGLAVAELLCREADRINPSRVRRPYRRTGRAPPVPGAEVLRELLQHCENASLIGQGCATQAFRSAERSHRFARPGRWAASSICSNLSFRYTQVELLRLERCWFNPRTLSYYRLG